MTTRLCLLFVCARAGGGGGDSTRLAALEMAVSTLQRSVNDQDKKLDQVGLAKRSRCAGGGENEGSVGIALGREVRQTLRGGLAEWGANGSLERKKEGLRGMRCGVGPVGRPAYRQTNPRGDPLLCCSLPSPEGRRSLSFRGRCSSCSKAAPAAGEGGREGVVAEPTTWGT